MNELRIQPQVGSDTKSFSSTDVSDLQTQMPVSSVILGPEMFKGQWLDSLGNKVFVCFEDELCRILVAHLSRPPRSDIKLFMRPVAFAGGWQCGNAVLDPGSDWPSRLRWVTEDGRISNWVRATDTDRHEESEPCRANSYEEDFVCATPESWD